MKTTVVSKKEYDSKRDQLEEGLQADIDFLGTL
jgi:hypothetical protein